MQDNSAQFSLAVLTSMDYEAFSSTLLDRVFSNSAVKRLREICRSTRP